MRKWEGEAFRALPFLEKKLPGWMWRLNTLLGSQGPGLRCQLCQLVGRQGAVLAPLFRRGVCVK